MSVILLDARCPDVFPLGAFGLTGTGVVYTSEVPISVRWALMDIFPTATSEMTGENPDAVLITTDADNEEVRRWCDLGHELLEVPTARLSPIAEAIEVMVAACTRGEWEAKQTHASLLPYLREETTEFIEAVERYMEVEQAGADRAAIHRQEEALRDELSDILLQVLFHADIARRRGAWDFSDVARAFVDKIRLREPFLFDGSTGMVSEAEQERLWQAGKARQRGE
ncbi:MAG: MazG nucleotide pyrophosphohydrolase domain-containing protein [Corynebacterium sp.]|nr:MazG nucleotide pyrophosphohydrolase domain-containing protein [Corynebacterium sp.]